jgi:hypothetical protein
VSFFTPAVIEALRRGAAVLADGVVFRFASETIALWPADGPLDASAFGGPTFLGIGALGRISSIELGTVAATQAVSFELSSLDPQIFAIAQDQQDEVQGRRVEIWRLVFDLAQPDRGNGLIACAKRRTLIMDKITTNVQPSADGPVMTISVTAEPLLAAKNRAGNSYLTDAEQRARYPGDKILERTSFAAGKRTVFWFS